MKLVKNITIILILLVILSVTILSVSATTVNDNLNSLHNISTTNNNLNQITANLNGLNYGDYSTDDNLQNGSLENKSINNNSNNNFPKTNLMDNLDVVQKSNSENNINKIEYLDNVNDLITPTEYTLNQTSNNTYIMTFKNNRTLTVGIIPINDYNSFKEAVDYISTKTVAFDAIIMDFKENLNLSINPWTDALIKMDYVKNLIIRGFGATISVNNPKEKNEFHFANVNSDANLCMNNITIEGFNTAICNKGNAQFNNVIFNNNRVNYIASEDYGGAIRNYGILKCWECSFIINYAKYGGAIYNEKGSQSAFTDCYYDNNVGYANKKGTTRTHDNNNIYTSKGSSCLVFNHDDEVIYLNIKSAADLENLNYNVDKLGKVKFLVVNFTNPQIYNINTLFLTFKNVENLYIYGNNAVINVANSKSSNENHFLKIEQGHFCSIKELNLKGFNTAIINQGSISISQSSFKENKIDYKIKKDYGGAIYNDEGLITIADTTFEDNYAKHGGAIYNEKGIISCVGCTFSSNKVYGDGGSIYNDIALLLCKNCSFINSFADDNGGSVFNHYGMISLNDIFFDESKANDDGSGIYNDFGEILASNCTFRQSISASDNIIYNYGKEAKCSIVGNSHIIKNTTAGIITENIKVIDDAPSEVLRWVLRIAEIGLCIALTVIAGFIPNTAIAFAISFIGGALLAGVEELVEGI